MCEKATVRKYSVFLIALYAFSMCESWLLRAEERMEVYMEQVKCKMFLSGSIEEYIKPERNIVVHVIIIVHIFYCILILQ